MVPAFSTLHGGFSLSAVTAFFQRPGSRQLLGWTALFASAFAFYFATVIIRRAEASVDIHTSYFVFARFLLGICVVSATMLGSRQKLKPVRWHLLIGRALANTIAVYCFYKTVQVSTVAEANIMNMTYPLYVALFSAIFLRTQTDAFSIIAVLAATLGIWLVLMPEGEFGFPVDNLWGVASGITAAAAIIYLNFSRRWHDSQTILFFMFSIGTVLLYIFFHDQIFWPDGAEFSWLFACSAVGVAGQYLLTFGFRYVTALEGSVIGSSRILLAALLGPLVAFDPPLGFAGWCGALMIFSANVALAAHRHRAQPLGKLRVP
jgi:drug/metabolite transporter (DMT)-like permease